MIYDTDDIPLSAAQLSVRSGTNKTFQIRVDCRASYKLKASPAPDLLVEGKRAADSIWVNLETNEIDLTPFAGTRETFEIRLTGDDETSIVRNIFSLKVSR